MRDAIAPWVDLEEREWEALTAIFNIRTVSAQEYLFLPGSTKHELLFVCEGLLRFFYVADDGTESNKAFIAENAFAGSLAASTLNLPVIYGVQALEPATMLVARYQDFEALFEVHPVFDRLGRKMAELLLARKELRTRSFLQQQAKDRYLDFMAQYPDLLQRVPQYHIASYLGITEVTLSRLRRTLVSESPS